MSIEPSEMALLCQKIENSIVGAPCGIMDQMTAVCGEAHKLLALLCQPATLQGMISIPDGISVWGLDSGVRHSVSGVEYSSVRVGAFMGYRMIADQAGLDVSPATAAERVIIKDPKWGGYLANITPPEFEDRYSRGLPDVISGLEFISRYRGTTDSVTVVDRDRTYPVRAATAHPIYEHSRIQTFARLLDGSFDDRTVTTMGELMYQSNASYSACGLGSEGTDLLVDLIRAAGPRNGLYGARVTGGGSGGTVAVLGRASAAGALESVANQYAEKTGYKPYIFRGSSPGAAAFGHLRMAANS
jgi:L-arabinokinase